MIKMSSIVASAFCSLKAYVLYNLSPALFVFVTRPHHLDATEVGLLTQVEPTGVIVLINVVESQTKQTGSLLQCTMGTQPHCTSAAWRTLRPQNSSFALR
jgi:hypothetical protein